MSILLTDEAQRTTESNLGPGIYAGRVAVEGAEALVEYHRTEGREGLVQRLVEITEAFYYKQTVQCDRCATYGKLDPLHGGPCHQAFKVEHCIPCPECSPQAEAEAIVAALVDAR
jgi:hypothetical protein